MTNNELKPHSVYYLHFDDDRELQNNWNRCQDYVCCVMANSQTHAIELTKNIALNQQNAKHIKIMGIGFCIEEWTTLPQPMRTDEANYSKQVAAMFERIYNSKK
jgi:hypothetical protein